MINDMKALLKILDFIILVLSFMGFVGGIGYTAYQGAWPITTGVMFLGCLAWPKFKETFKELAN